MPRTHTADPLDVVRRLRYLTDRVAVGFSCGKDSAALLDLCLRWFDRVAPFYMYFTPGLSFHEAYIRAFEERGKDKIPGGKVLRMPHWALSHALRDATLRDDGLAGEGVPRLTLKDIEVRVRKETGFDWFVYGQKKGDSLERRGMLSRCDGIDLKARRAFPLAEWSNRSVTQYLRGRGIPLSPEYAALGVSYGGHLKADVLSPLRKHFPEDYARVRERFPFVDAEVYRYEAGLRGDDLVKTRRQA